MEDNEPGDGDLLDAIAAGDARGAVAAEVGSDEEEEEQFDISLPAAHSYMGEGMVTMSGRLVLEAGWEGRVPAVARHGTVFPGETVPLLVHNSHDALLLSQALRKDKMFGLLCPDETGSLVSGYGVLCEVFEAGLTADGEPVEDGDEPSAREVEAYEDARLVLSLKARAVHRFRFVDMPKCSVPIHAYVRVKYVKVRVLPEVQLLEPLRHTRLASLDPLRRSRSPMDRVLRSMDAATTPWPLFVYDIFDYRRMRAVLQDHFESIMLAESMPTEMVSLSFWVASNLTLSARERLALFVADEALLRLRLAVRFLRRRAALCCAACGGELARRDHVVPMSSEGVHANYTNIGGFMHDIVTVSRAYNVRLAGGASAEFTWFPGYTWTIANCAACSAHVGWRFDAQRRNLRPGQFFALGRNYVAPRVDGARPPRARTPPRPAHAPHPPHLPLPAHLLRDDDDYDDADDM